MVVGAGPPIHGLVGIAPQFLATPCCDLRRAADSVDRRSLVPASLEAPTAQRRDGAGLPAHPINLSTAIVTYLLSGTAGILSSLPGGIGVNEAAATLLLQQAGLPTALAMSIAILRRICTVWSITGLVISQGLMKYEA